MADLQEEYTDVKGRRHRVKHLTVSTDDDPAVWEKIREELFHTLTQAEEHCCS